MWAFRRVGVAGTVAVLTGLSPSTRYTHNVFAQASQSWAHVQTSAANVGSGTNAVTFSGPTNRGDLIVVEVDWSEASTFLAISDSQGNVFTPVGTEQASGAVGVKSRLYYATNIQGGAETVTTVVSGAPRYHELYIHEYSGLDPISPLDAFSVNVGNGPAFTSNALTTTASNDLLFGIEIDSGAGTAGAGWTPRSTLDSNIAAATNAASPGSIAFTGTSAGASIAWIVAFKQP